MIKMIRSLCVVLFSTLSPLVAQDRAAEIVAGLSAHFRTMPSYEVGFQVEAGEWRMAGNYVVENGRYRLVLGDAEVYADAAVRYEIDHRRREVTINPVDTASRNILDNPVRAFDFLGSEYAPSLVSEHDGEAVIALKPAGGTGASTGTVALTVATQEMRPRSIRYDFEGERIVVRIDRVGMPDRAFEPFDRTRYADYEWIDFR